MRPGRGPRTSWLSGMHSVEETLKARPETVRRLLVENGSKHPGLGDLVRRARSAGARVAFVDRRELGKLAGPHHQGVAAEVMGSAAPLEGLPEFLESLDEEAKKGMVLVALDQIQDPHNLGAIARSALNLGASALLLPDRRTAPVTAAAVSTSAGAIQKLKVVGVGNLGQALERCKEAGFWVYGADMGGTPVWDAVLNTPMVLVIGSEGSGMRSLVRDLCDEVVSIPQAAGGVESLNASCAASVLLFEAARQRHLGSRSRG